MSTYQVYLVGKEHPINVEAKEMRPNGTEKDRTFQFKDEEGRLVAEFTASAFQGAVKVLP